MNKETAKRPELIAYTVTESGGENRYHRIGAAWQNSKGGYKIRLHALPLDGDILLLPPKDPA
ncbi:hypothetical protein E4P82_20075 [Candidatus Competibacter phosphatis]|jgi:hypothetical protein|uniref:Uncharacterized protein n=1 Tax=Candidatus Competibacter phosphatis TaxID=221280 RepID=A0ABX1TPC9_9GAMM|nr:hypothetical protein [Candidatus Competibacter phosphatis]NMQ21295.1 hypothetical protein [Candidatus Competibacter phosphatis]